MQPILLTCSFAVELSSHFKNLFAWNSSNFKHLQAMQSIDGNFQLAFRSDYQIERQIQYSSVVYCPGFVKDDKFKVCDFISLRRLFVHSPVCRLNSYYKIAIYLVPDILVYSWNFETLWGWVDAFAFTKAFVYGLVNSVLTNELRMTHEESWIFMELLITSRFPKSSRSPIRGLI